MPVNLENSPIAPGLEKVSCHSNPKEGQCRRMFKLPHNCIHFTLQGSNARNPSEFAEVRLQQYINQKNFQINKLGLERQRNQKSNCQHLLSQRKSKRIPEKTSASLTMLNPLTVSYQ